MKIFLTILALIFLSAFKTDKHIFYVLDTSGKEIAKRFDNGKWEVRDVPGALEKMYLEKTTVERKYRLAEAILKCLDVNGNIGDRKKYLEAVKQFNDR